MQSPAHALLPPGVVVLERGWLSSNNVVVRGSTEAAIVDSGYWTHAEQTIALVDGAAGDQPVSVLVNTHLHSDHCGGNSALQAHFPGLKTFIPPGLAASVRQWDPVALTYVPTGQHCPPFRIDSVLSAGQTIQLGDLAWEVHAAPGHDPHSVVLFEPRSRTLISADALWQNGFGVVFPELEGHVAFDEVERTLDVIEHLRPVVVIPGHGNVFNDVDGALDRARSRLAAYVADPRRHATHAAKVLLKFKLLELQQVDVADFLTWAESTAYFRIVHQRWFADLPATTWTNELLGELVKSGVAAREGTRIHNA
ncbi:MAG TPA: MBL fold metallo-hydrolase [Ramlibacter sp.]|uniref:MBL fold metallo-hydrolase n=1 Tax=Ramlibacter sp. TaxID=1917967 RepID=UPI002ED0097C